MNIQNSHLISGMGNGDGDINKLLAEAFVFVIMIR
jgi:hypothetical protein